MNSLYDANGIQWTLNKTDSSVGDVCNYILRELNVVPLYFCSVLEKDLRTTCENGYIIFSDREIYVPLTCLRGQSLSLPVFLFSMLFGSSTHACFVWSKLDMYKNSIVHNMFFYDALRIVGDWFFGIYMNCPVMDDAIRVGRCDLKRMVSELAYRFRLSSGFRTSENMRRLTYFLDTPWRITRGFLSTFLDISIRSSIHYRGLGIEKDGKGDNTFYILRDGCRRYIDVEGHIIVEDRPLPETNDIILEKIQRLLLEMKNGKQEKENDTFEFGLLCCPRDKLVFLAVLLFSTDYNVFNTFTENVCNEKKSNNYYIFRKKQKVIFSEFPEPLQVIIQFLARPYEATFQLPEHFQHL